MQHRLHLAGIGTLQPKIRLPVGARAARPREPGLPQHRRGQARLRPWNFGA
jgi:hypothetical protein